MKRRLFVLMSLTATAARARMDRRRVPVPLVTPEAHLDALYARWYQPRAREFASSAHALVAALDRHCTASAHDDARRAWMGAMTSWERLNAVAIGPLIERRSAHRIDFVPTRPASIERAIQGGATDLAVVGGPAKGLPALEWLLWSTAAVKPSTPACDYARRIAVDVAGEAHALADAFVQPRRGDADARSAAFAEALNQFVGGIEQLRFAQIEKPHREGRGRFPRALSKSTQAAWSARWQSLRTLAVLGAGATDAPISLEAYLRGRGLNALADRLVGAVKRADVALTAASPSRAASLAAAARELSSLKRLIEADAAPALTVTLGFSDGDGD